MVMGEDKISRDKQVYLLEHFLGGAIAIHVASLVGGKAKTAYSFSSFTRDHSLLYTILNDMRWSPTSARR